MGNGGLVTTAGPFPRVAVVAAEGEIANFVPTSVVHPINVPRAQIGAAISKLVAGDRAVVTGIKNPTLPLIPLDEV